MFFNDFRYYRWVGITTRWNELEVKSVLGSPEETHWRCVTPGRAFLLLEVPNYKGKTVLSFTSSGIKDFGKVIWRYQLTMLKAQPISLWKVWMSLPMRRCYCTCRCFHSYWLDPCRNTGCWLWSTTVRCVLGRTTVMDLKMRKDDSQDLPQLKLTEI